MHHFMRMFAFIIACIITATSAISLDLSSTDSIKDASKTIAERMVTYYSGNKPGGTPGLLPEPHYWWEAGGMFGSLIDYWHYTGDTQFHGIIYDAIINQASPGFNFMPPNQTKSEGNDDQVFWAFAAMTAAEYAFPEPTADHPSWVAMAQAVWNSQQGRWDDGTCGGGLRWQIVLSNLGWTYKNSPSNAGFMNLGARLYAYTNNETYAHWVQNSWHWMESIGLISDTYAVFDGSDTTINCTQLDHTLWTYSAGMAMHTAAIMWNVTENETWKHRVNGIWNASSTAFFNKNMVMYERRCEPTNNCNLDQVGFKAYYSRFIAATIKFAPWLYDVATPYLEASAKAAAAQCTGGDSGTDCGTKWTNNGVYDGETGMGQQMCALQIITANLIEEVSAPVNEDNGGISTPNATFGLGGDKSDALPEITTREKTGAICITVALIVWTLGGAWFLVVE